MGDAAACSSDGICDIRPGIASASAACFDDTEGGSVSGAALFGPGSEAEASGNDGDAQGALGLVVRRRQGVVADEGDDSR